MWGTRSRRKGTGFATAPPVVTERLVIRAAFPSDMDGLAVALKSEPAAAVPWDDEWVRQMQRIVGGGAGVKLLKVICERGSGTIVGLLWERSADQLSTERVHLMLWTASAHDADGYFGEVLAGYVPRLHERGFRSVCCEVIDDTDQGRALLQAAGFEHVDTVQRQRADGSMVMASVYEHRERSNDQSV